MSTILIVDDVQTDRELMGKVVTQAGHSPVYASDGEEAILKAKQHKPALIFLDVVMPTLNGFNTCRKLKSDEALAAMNGLPAEDHIGKPWSPDQVLSVIRRYCR